MKKITNVIIVDASGSMHSKTKQVKDGLTEILQDIRKDMKENKDEAKIRTILVQFSSQGWSINEGWFEVLLDTKKRKNVTLDCVESYKANGGTALFDAIGKSFAMVGKKQDGVFVSILTDGEENSSKEFTQKDIKKLLKKVERKNGVLLLWAQQKRPLKLPNLGVLQHQTL